MSSDKELDQIKEDHFVDFRESEVWMIVRVGDRFQVQHWTPTGVAPQSDYADTYYAAARLLQLLCIKRPVYPQDWPRKLSRLEMSNDPSGGGVEFQTRS